MDIDDATFIAQLKAKLPQLIDTQYEQEKYLMKEVSIMGYLLDLLELMKKKQDPFEVILLDYTAAKFHVDSGINSKMKSFITQLLYSYQKQTHKSNDLSYIKRFIYIRRQPSTITFYMKLRKLILQNFSYDSRSQMLDGMQLKFGIPIKYVDDWSTLTTRFLGANHIQTIGTKVKEENLKTRVYDKILTNSIDANIFVSLCVEIHESNLIDKQQSPKQTNVQSDNEEHVSVVNQSIADVKKEIEAGSPSKKLLSQLQETKYQLVDDKMKQQIIISKTVRIFENLTEDYYQLMKHSKDQMQFIIFIASKLKKGQQLNEQEQQKICELSAFNYLTQDPKQQLMKIGAYDYAK